VGVVHLFINRAIECTTEKQVSNNTCIARVLRVFFLEIQNHNIRRRRRRRRKRRNKVSSTHLGAEAIARCRVTPLPELQRALRLELCSFADIYSRKEVAYALHMKKDREN
jgi:hypothetical protein